MERTIVPILGVPLTSTYEEKVLNELVDRSLKMERRLVVTPNPEIVLKAQKEKALARILARSDIALPDGIGLAWAAKFLSLKAPETHFLRLWVLFFQGAIVTISIVANKKWLSRGGLSIIPGRVLFEKIVVEAAKRGLRVFLLGGKPGIAKKVESKLVTSYPPAKTGTVGHGESLVTNSTPGPWLDNSGRPVNSLQAQIEKRVLRDINAFKPHFLFVGFGAPKQEKWLYRNLPKLKVGVGMVVGGSFDYLAGVVPYPPKLLSNLGLEWLWRLLIQPERVKRVFDAVWVFPLKVFIYKLTH